MTSNQVLKLLKTINIRKATGEDTIPPKLVKLAADNLAKPLTDVINLSIETCVFPDKAKIASVSPFDKGSSNKNAISNFRPVSILNCFSKVFEKSLKAQMMSYLKECISIFVSAYRSSYSTQYVILRLLEEWRENLDSDFLVGCVLMDLSKAFDCIPHELLLAKLSAYGFDNKALAYIYSYLSKRKQAVRINNTYSSFQEIISGVPQGSVLGPILFNVFINDLFIFIKDASLHNYADDNTISAFSKTLPELIEILQN